MYIKKNTQNRDHWPPFLDAKTKIQARIIAISKFKISMHVIYDWKDNAI